MLGATGGASVVVVGGVVTVVVVVGVLVNVAVPVEVAELEADVV